MRDVRHPEAPEGRSVSRQTLGLAMAVWLVLPVLGFGAVTVAVVGRGVSRQTLGIAMAVWLVILVLGFGAVTVAARGGV